MSDVNLVAVGEDNASTIKYSKDGKNWQNATGSQFSDEGYGVASKYSLFVPRIL